MADTLPPPAAHPSGSVAVHNENGAEDNTQLASSSSSSSGNNTVNDVNIDPSLTSSPDPAVGPKSKQVNGTSTTTTGDTSSVSKDETSSLKKTYLNLLPTERLVSIVLKLAVHAPSEVLAEIWPKDMKAAVVEAAVAAIVGTAASVAAGDVHAGEKNKAVGALQALGIDSPAGEGRKEASTTSRSEPSSNTQTSTAPTSTANGSAEKGSTTSSSTSRPAPPSPIPDTPSNANTTAPSTPAPSFQPAPQPSLFSNPFASGTFSYQATTFNQAYFGPSPPPPPPPSQSSPVAGPSYSSPAPPPPPPMPTQTQFVHGSAGVPGNEEDDLPSYEDMICQALLVINDPSGVAPKQLFQWMASTYPLQANFRPSASQALQKAFKRGRFEKNQDGRYRLNPMWMGGHSARRTTRRPQSYSKAVTNPNPSSHQPANASQFPPHHYTWTYGPGAVGKTNLSFRNTLSQSPAPPGQAFTPPLTSGGDEDAGANDVEENARDSMEAAYSILQALNMVPRPQSESNDRAESVGATTQPDEDEPAGLDDFSSNDVGEPAPADSSTTTSGTAPERPVQTGGKGGKKKTAPKSATFVPPPIFAAETDFHTPMLTLPVSAAATTATNPISISTLAQEPSTSSRAQLQGALALLAAQLAELASEQSTSAAATSSNNAGVLESLGLGGLTSAGLGIDSSAWADIQVGHPEGS